MQFESSRSVLLRSARIACVAFVCGCTGVVGDQNTPAASGAGGAGAVAGSGPAASAGTSSAPTAGASGVGGGAGDATEFPCEVQKLLAEKCQVCHRVDPPGLMLSVADLARASVSEPQKTVAQVALERLQAAGVERMPPAPLAAATPDEVAAFSAWVAGGAMATGCGQTVPVAPDPYDTPLVCTSDMNWTGGNRESPLMRPGGACIKCHTEEGEGPIFAVGGTLYPTPHEPDDCNGVSGSAAGATVVITEADGTVHELSVNQAGNFYLEKRSFAYPYQAKVVYMGSERVMVEAQEDGDCNECHTQDGTEDAPGRIFLP